MTMKEYLAYLDEWEKDPDSRPRSRRAASVKRRNEAVEEAALLVEATDNAAGGFNPSFHSSKHEREWIMQYLGPFYDDNLLLDVLYQVKGGKEATVYCCSMPPARGGGLIAAKVYRPRMFRNLRNDAVYREGRAALDADGKEARGRRERVALMKKTRYGQDLRHLTWLTSEYETLTLLHAAGGDVPRPLAHNDNAILMEYLGDARRAAATLQGTRLPPGTAQSLFDRLMGNVELMLSLGRVHGDLSAHNILYWEGAVKIIDFPQAVNPDQNPNALALLQRDVERVCQYFAHYGVQADSGQIATDLWRRYMLADNQ